MHRPNFFEHRYTGGNKFPAVVVKKELLVGIKEGLDLDDLLPMYTLLYPDKFKA
jgi:hypothetical protein